MKFIFALVLFASTSFAAFASGSSSIPGEMADILKRHQIQEFIDGVLQIKVADNGDEVAVVFEGLSFSKTQCEGARQYDLNFRITTTKAAQPMGANCHRHLRYGECTEGTYATGEGPTTLYFIDDLVCEKFENLK